MAVIALTSASGSPGVTTTAVALALLWPRPVLLVEADPSGGSGILAGYFRGAREYDGGLIQLALSPADVSDALAQQVRPIEGSNVSFMTGIRSHVQAPALRDVWEPLAGVFAGMHAQGQDVVIDAGRLGLVGAPSPLLAAADVTLLCTRANLPSLAAARSWTEKLVADRAWLRPGVLVIGEADPYRPAEIAKALSIPVVATLAEDDETAAVFSRGAAPGRRFENRPLMRGLRAAVEVLRAGANAGADFKLSAVAR